MEIEEFDGTVIELTDEQVENMLRRFSPVDTCRFHLEKGGVQCDAKTRKPGQCEQCGWNPQVSRRRIYRMKSIWKEFGL